MVPVSRFESMPELPEVEVTRRGIEPYLLGSRVSKAIVRSRQLRWLIATDIEAELAGRRIQRLTRRGKYLLIHTDTGTLIIHLGMSGSLRIVATDTRPAAHDHFDLVFRREPDNQRVLRFTDARRFGSIVWTKSPPLHHKLLASLGVEPLVGAFDGTYLYRRSRCRKVAVKQFVMDAKVVVGIGNIYANEALFLAGIHPMRRAGRISLARYKLLAASIQEVLRRAIDKGGTTLKDFVQADGRPGYFRISLRVYGREGLPCSKCRGRIICRRVGQRSSFYCANCQR